MRAQTPIAPQFMPANYRFSAAVPAMGQHMIDAEAPELADPPAADFTQSFLYGAYDGHIIFYEPMVNLAYLQSQPDDCLPFPLPEAWEASGHYPTQSCIRYSPDRDEYDVSLEGFVYREQP